MSGTYQLPGKYYLLFSPWSWRIFPEVADGCIISDPSRVLWDAQFSIRRRNYILCCCVYWTQTFFIVFSISGSRADNTDVLAKNIPYPSSLPTPFSSVHSSSEGLVIDDPQQGCCVVKTSISRPVVDVVGMVPVFFLWRRNWWVICCFQDISSLHLHYFTLRAVAEIITSPASS